MTPASITLWSCSSLVVFLLASAIGLYLADVMQADRSGRCAWDRASKPGFIDSRASIPTVEMRWTKYAIALLVFNTLGALFVYLLQRLQLWLPLNPQHFANVSPDSAFNTAVSFITNTNWQGYSGESTMSYLTQMAGLAVQNVPVRRDRHRCGNRAHSRICASRHGDDRQISGPI